MTDRIEEIRKRCDVAGPLWVHGQLANEWHMAGQNINRNMGPSHKQEVLDALVAIGEDIPYLLSELEKAKAENMATGNQYSLFQELEIYKKALELATGYIFKDVFDSDCDRGDQCFSEYWLDKAKRGEGMKLSELIDNDPQSFLDRSPDACGQEDCSLRISLLVPEIEELEDKLEFTQARLEDKERVLKATQEQHTKALYALHLCAKKHILVSDTRIDSWLAQAEIAIARRANDCL